MMQGGQLSSRDGADDDLGMFMSDGFIFIQGTVGQRW